MDNDVVGVIAVLMIGCVVLALVAFSVFVWWRIISRTGHSGWLSLLMFIPVANIVVLLILAFGEWPIYRELEDLRRRVAVTA